MSDPLAVKPTNPVVNWATAAGVVGLAIGGFTLSFSSLRDLAIRSGVPEELAFVWPLIVDGFIVVATMAAYALKGRKRGSTVYPWFALVVFSVISVAGNAIHAMDQSAELSVPVPVATVVSAVPAVALLVASHLLVVMIGGKTAKPARSIAKREPSVDLGAVAVVSGPRPAPPRAVESAIVPDLVAALEAAKASGEQVTGTLIARLEGASERTGRRRMVELRLTHPHLFESQQIVEVGA